MSAGHLMFGSFRRLDSDYQDVERSEYGVGVTEDLKFWAISSKSARLSIFNLGLLNKL